MIDQIEAFDLRLYDQMRKVMMMTPAAARFPDELSESIPATRTTDEVMDTPANKSRVLALDREHERLG